jgi:hypothetical protein
VGPSVYWRIDKVGHVLGMSADVKVYREKLEAFFKEAEVSVRM